MPEGRPMTKSDLFSKQKVKAHAAKVGGSFHLFYLPPLPTSITADSASIFCACVLNHITVLRSLFYPTQNRGYNKEPESEEKAKCRLKTVFYAFVQLDLIFLQSPVLLL